VSEDGLRPDAIARAKTPNHQRIMREGSFAPNARTIRTASTLPSHAAMLSGFDVAEHGLTWNSWKPERGFIRVPTVFTAAGHSGGGTAAFVGKRKLEHIARPGSVDVFERPGFFCKRVVAEAAEYFTSRRPQIEFVHFSDPDERGHAVGWMSDEQIHAIAASDRCLGTLIDAVEAAGLAQDTLVIVSSDHGGAGRNHSGRRPEDRMIPWIAWGAGVRRGHRLRTPVTTVDTAATALWALGHDPPEGLRGQPIREAFEDRGH
jgi:arylsulfatase A-like enzyme